MSHILQSHEIQRVSRGQKHAWNVQSSTNVWRPAMTVPMWCELAGCSRYAAAMGNAWSTIVWCTVRGTISVDADCCHHRNLVSRTKVPMKGSTVPGRAGSGRQGQPVWMKYIQELVASEDHRAVLSHGHTSKLNRSLICGFSDVWNSSVTVHCRALLQST